MYPNRTYSATLFLFQFTSNSDFHFLEVVNVQTQDKGSYSCVLRNEHGQASSAANLEVYGKKHYVNERTYMCTVGSLVQVTNFREGSCLHADQYNPHHPFHSWPSMAGVLLSGIMRHRDLVWYQYIWQTLSSSHLPCTPKTWVTWKHSFQPEVALGTYSGK